MPRRIFSAYKISATLRNKRNHFFVVDFGFQCNCERCTTGREYHTVYKSDFFSLDEAK